MISHNPEAHPTDERLAAHLMLALYASGRRAEALDHHQVVRARLVDGLGTEPGALLREVHLRVLGQELAPADALVSLGKVHTALGEREEARTVWSQAAELHRGQGRHAQLAEVTGRPA